MDVSGGLYGFPEYLSTVTGIAREGLYFGYVEEDGPTSPEVSRHLERLLDQFVAAGRLVLVVDYTTRPEQIERSYQRARSQGYIPFTTVRDLGPALIGAIPEHPFFIRADLPGAWASSTL